MPDERWLENQIQNFTWRIDALTFQVRRIANAIELLALAKAPIDNQSPAPPCVYCGCLFPPVENAPNTNGPRTCPVCQSTR